jgi:hypothetical protein
LLNNKFKLNCKSQQGRAETLGAVNQRIPWTSTDLGVVSGPIRHHSKTTTLYYHCLMSET